VSASDPSADPADARASRIPASTTSRSRYTPFSTTPPEIPDHELIECIGHGSFGDVWLARTVMGAYRAVKIVYRHAFDHPRPYERELEGIRRFEPVSRRHESQLAVLQVGRNDAAGYFYYVMELADDGSRRIVGEASLGAAGAAAPGMPGTIQAETYVPRTLKSELERRGRLPVEECLRIGLSLATALEHLHGYGLIHRDIKPSNIIFIDGLPKLADIGLISTLDATMSVSGTPGYIAPEGSGTPQADIYSLGKVLYEMSMGRDRAEFPRLPEDFETLPDRQRLLELNAVVVKAGSGNPAHRYQAAAELHADLALIRSGRSVKGLRRMERHLAQIRRLAAVLAVVTLLIAGVWWQTRRAQRIANEHLVRLHVEHGTQHLQEGNYLAALPWLVGALRLEPGGAEREEVHRRRIAAVLRRCPRPVGVFSMPEAPVLDADINAEGSHVVTAHYDGQTRFWEVSSGNLLRELPDDLPVYFCRCLSRDNQVLTATFRRQARIWDPRSSERVSLVLPHYNQIGAGPIYAVGVNAATQRAYLTLGTFTGARTNRFTGDLKDLTLCLVATGEGDNVRLRYQVRDRSAEGTSVGEAEFLDTPGADPLAYGRETEPEPLTGPVWLVLYAMGWLGDEALGEGRAVFSEIRARSYPSQAEQPPSWQRWTDFTQESMGDWLSLDWEFRSAEYQLEDGHLVLPVVNGLQGITGVACLTPFEIKDRQTIEVEADLVEATGGARVIELGLGRPPVSRPVALWDPRVSPDGNWLAVAPEDGLIQIWDLAADRFLTIQTDDGERRLQLQHADRMSEVDFAPDGRLLATVTRDDAEVAVWELTTGRRVSLEPPLPQGVREAKFSPDGRFLAVNGADGLVLVSVADWRTAGPPLDPSTIGRLTFSPVGHWLAGVRDGRSIHLWDMTDLAAPPLILEHEFAVERMTFSPDGHYLASDTEDGYVRLWTVATGRQSGPPLPGDLVRFSADGDALLLTVPDHGVWLWDLSHIRPEVLTVPPVLALESATSSPDNQMRAILAAKDVVVQGPGQRHGPFSHPLPLRRVWFSSANRYLVAETSDLRSWIWDVATDSLMSPPVETRYDASMEGYPDVNLPLTTWNDETLTDVAALLSGQRPDGEGGMEPVTPEARERLFRRLRGEFSPEFSLGIKAQKRWQIQQAEECEREGAWAGAVFHWERVVNLTGHPVNEAVGRDRLSEISNRQSAVSNQLSTISGPSAEARLAYSRQAAEEARAAIRAGRSRTSFIAPRSPWADPNLLDLGPYYTQSLHENVAPAERDNSFGQLGSGVRVLGGVEFDVRGFVQVQAGESVRIPLNHPVRRLHFLHAAKRTERFSRQVAGTYQLTFGSGEAAAVEVLCPSDLLPYHTAPFHSRFSGSDVESSPELHTAVAWAGTNAEMESRNETLYLTRTTWELPESHQGKIIESLELQASPSGPVPLIFAITVE